MKQIFWILFYRLHKIEDVIPFTLVLLEGEELNWSNQSIAKKLQLIEQWNSLFPVNILLKLSLQLTIFIEFLFWNILRTISEYWCFYLVHFLIILQKLLCSFPKFLWCIPSIQPFNPFELIKFFIDFPLNILFLLGFNRTTSIFSILPWWGFNNWY